MTASICARLTVGVPDHFQLVHLDPNYFSHLRSSRLQRIMNVFFYLFIREKKKKKFKNVFSIPRLLGRDDLDCRFQ